ncbi:SGNH/GDSL hydrolase family protein [Gordonia sp. (in: high G+C Gram-positive bacteria)]|uniref:SGNH/GDSL hydrolase family protein n=1 Tax=Gordonia sp. (in: high G+C Gram-positive bacteria) TaxID=84139 RepID=UPI003C715F3A
MASESRFRTVVLPAFAALAAVVAVAAGAIWIIDATPDDDDTVANSPAPVAGPQLVHLGDSFASGAGTTPLVEDSPVMCQRAQANFGERIAATRKLTVTDVSCAGATTEDFRVAQYDGVGPQLDSLSTSAKYVTVMIGGNDGALFTTLVGECTRLAQDDPTGSPCTSALGRKPFRAIATHTQPDVTATLAEIRRRAPNAQVLIVGYPRLMPAARTCRPAVGIADGDLDYVNRIEAALNAAVRAAAKATGVTYVDLERPFAGHDACAARGTRWIEPQYGADTAVVMHPNERGQEAIAAAVAAQMR